MLALSLLVSQQEGYAARVPTLEEAHPEARAFAEQLEPRRPDSMRCACSAKSAGPD